MTDSVEGDIVLQLTALQEQIEDARRYLAEHGSVPGLVRPSLVDMAADVVRQRDEARADVERTMQAEAAIRDALTVQRDESRAEVERRQTCLRCRTIAPPATMTAVEALALVRESGHMTSDGLAYVAGLLAGVGVAP
jgi:hypothetical protein